jgi:hypothetical protein
MAKCQSPSCKKAEINDYEEEVLTITREGSQMFTPFAF